MFSGAFSGAFGGTAVWPWEIGAGMVGPLRGQALLGMGESIAESGGVVMVGGRQLMTATGKPYRFASTETMQQWAQINAARARSELVIARSMSGDRLDVWRARKRERLQAAAAGYLAAAEKVGDENIAAALIEEADFALAKWELL